VYADDSVCSDGILPIVAVCCSKVQRVAVCGSVLQCVLECCSVTRSSYVGCTPMVAFVLLEVCEQLQCAVVCVLQCIAGSCSVLQCIVGHCSVTQGGDF